VVVLVPAAPEPVVKMVVVRLPVMIGDCEIVMPLALVIVEDTVVFVDAVVFVDDSIVEEEVILGGTVNCAYKSSDPSGIVKLHGFDITGH